jgi:hypothetical protein
VPGKLCAREAANALHHLQAPMIALRAAWTRTALAIVAIGSPRAGSKRLAARKWLTLA